MALSSPDNLHSRLVGWLKIGLPLAALAVLATLFLFARKIDPSDAIPYAEVDVQERLREPRMTDASYSGVTSDGAAINLQADAAIPGADGQAKAVGLTARLQAPDGSTTDLRAKSGQMDRAAGTVSLDSGVQVDTSSGYHLRTERVVMALDRTLVTIPAQVQADGPAGKITADSAVLNSADDDSGHHHLVFKGNVKLIYLPKP
jgi:lipopolysaccharide export system protein LptC